MLTDDWPIIIIEFPETRIQDSALQDCLFYVELLLREAVERREKTYTITDLSRMTEFPPASQRNLTTEWLARSLQLQKASSLGGANVSRSTMLRGFLNAVQWIAPPAMPSVFVATRGDGFVAAIKAFEDARIPLKSDLRASLLKR